MLKELNVQVGDIFEMSFNVFQDNTTRHFHKYYFLYWYYHRTFTTMCSDINWFSPIFVILDPVLNDEKYMFSPN